MYYALHSVYYALDSMHFTRCTYSEGLRTEEPFAKFSGKSKSYMVFMEGRTGMMPRWFQICHRGVACGRPSCLFTGPLLFRPIFPGLFDMVELVS